MHLRPWLLPMLAVLLLGLTVSALAIWLLWPVQCDSTSIGFAAGQPDPNLHACTRRIGTIASRDNVRVSAVLWGQLIGASVVALGAAAIWWRTRRPPPSH